VLHSDEELSFLAELLHLVLKLTLTELNNSDEALSFWMVLLHFDEELSFLMVLYNSVLEQNFLMEMPDFY
jgi:hypothetical protein